MADPWTEKHRPRSLDQVAGNPGAVEQLRRWADAWEQGRPSHKAVLLAGPPGCGKTSAALALALERKWGIIELNASDVRSAPAIRRVAGEGSLHETFSETGEFHSTKEGRRKLILLDEADNLYERAVEGGMVAGEDYSDRGGKRAMMETVVNSRQPIVLIANDAYALTRGSTDRFSKAVLKIPFRRLTSTTIRKLLQQVAAQEGVAVADDALNALVARSEGDLRSAVNDLQSLAAGRARVDEVPAAWGERNREATLFDAVGRVLRTENAREAVEALRAVDEPPDYLLLWLDENVPSEYRKPDHLARAYDWLSRADVFLGRVQRRQQYGLWGYATELMGAGVAVARDRPYGTPPHYQFPSWLRQMASSRGLRGVRDSLGSKLGAVTHTGVRAAVRDQLPVLAVACARNRGFAEEMGLRLELDEDELRLLLRDHAKPEYIEDVIKRVEARREQAPAQGSPAVPESADEPDSSARREAGGRTKSLLDF